MLSTGTNQQRSEITNTNITTKISTEDYNNLIDETDAVSLYREIIKENIEYEYLVQDVGITGKDNLDEIVEILAETVGVDREKIQKIQEEHKIAQKTSKQKEIKRADETR